MTQPARVGLRALCLALGALTPALAAHAQTPAQPEAAAPYQDKVIEGLAPDTPSDGPGFQYDAGGLPRFLRLETRLGTQPFEADRRARLGFAAYGLIETPNHGTLSLDASVDPREGRGALTLRQHGLPLDGGWLAHHELGVINTPAPAITRLPSRVFVPSSTVQGVAAEWNHAARGLQLQASTGQPGRLEGLPASSFSGLSGRRSTLGAQWHLGSESPPLQPLRGWTLALQHEDAHRVSLLDQPTQPADTADARSTLLALRHETEGSRIQGQAVTTRASDVAGPRSGFWIDGEWDDGPRQHGLGYYRLQPDLGWAHQPLPSDLEGVTLRSQWRTRQWSAEGSVDWLRTLSGRAGVGSYANGSARWRLAQGASLGAGGSVRRFDDSAWSTFGDWRFPSTWGTSGLRLELGGGANEADTNLITYDQDWAVPSGWTLASSLGLGRSGAVPSTSEPAQRLWRAALAFAAPITGNASVRGNLNTEHSSSGTRQWGLNVGAQWRIDPRWSVEANLNRNTGRSLISTSLDPLTPPTALVSTRSDRSFYAVLRYELQAGSRSAPLGGKAQDGGGRIEGTVFFDANRSGTQEASETGAPGVTVTLDNRYAVRTDAQGRFEFPFVAAGPRTVTVRNDTLPLPWGVVDDGQVKVDVRLRETTQLVIPVRRND